MYVMMLLFGLMWAVYFSSFNQDLLEAKLESLKKQLCQDLSEPSLSFVMNQEARGRKWGQQIRHSVEERASSVSILYYIPVYYKTKRYECHTIPLH